MSTEILEQMAELARRSQSKGAVFRFGDGDPTPEFVHFTRLEFEKRGGETDEIPLDLARRLLEIIDGRDR